MYLLWQWHATTRYKRLYFLENTWISTFLSTFYKLFGITQTKINDNEKAIQIALWTQVIINSFIPLFILFLAFAITNSLFVSTVTAWIIALHPGFILSSGFLLSEGIALIFFFLFLLGLYSILYKPSPQKSHSDLSKISADKSKNYTLLNFYRSNNVYFLVIFAALALGITTWIRPMGQFVLVVSVGLLFIFDNTPLKNRLKKIGLFTLIFFASISPWYIRNYNLTGRFFFCPMFGVYLNTFNAPKIVRRIKKVSLEDAIRMLYEHAHLKINKKKKALTGTTRIVSKEAEVGQLACKIICAHPFWFIYDWIKEVLKTIFDLYTYQLVALHNNIFKYDPVEEFLLTKWSETLWLKPLPSLTRLLAWLEVFYTLFLWIGIFLGNWFLILKPVTTKGLWALWQDPNRLWLITAFIMFSLVFMTGGFGYARLRLPAEPLLIILSLMGWIHISI